MTSGQRRRPQAGRGPQNRSDQEAAQVTLPEVARLFGVDRQTPYEWSKRPAFPPSVGKRGRCTTYSLQQVETWHRWHFSPVRVFVQNLRVMPFGHDGTPCLFWTGTLDDNGYGQFRAGLSSGVGMGAHRYAYDRWWGPIPKGLELDHLCRRPSCCNPRHLEPVTHAVNVERGVAPSAVISKSGACGRGHERNEQNTYYRPSGKSQCRVCARSLDRERRSSKARA